MPLDVMRDEESIDFTCSNEGVYTILNLLKINNKEDHYLKGKFMF